MTKPSFSYTLLPSAVLLKLTFFSTLISLIILLCSCSSTYSKSQSSPKNTANIQTTTKGTAKSNRKNKTSTLSEPVSKEAEINYNLGISHLNTGRYEEGLQSFTLAKNLSPNFLNNLKALAISYHHLGKHELALTIYQEALNISPNNSDVYNHLGVLYLSMGKTDQAIDVLSKAAADLFYTQNNLAKANLGKAYFIKKDYKKSVYTLSQTLEKDPNFCLAYLWLNDALQAKGTLNAKYTLSQAFDERCADTQSTTQNNASFNTDRNADSNQNLLSKFELKHYHQMKYQLGSLHLHFKKPALALQSFIECADNRTSYGQDCIKKQRELSQLFPELQSH